MVNHAASMNLFLKVKLSEIRNETQIEEGTIKNDAESSLEKNSNVF